MTREDFIFTIGFDGHCAVVDKKSKKEYGKMAADELLKKGFMKAAVWSAVYSANQEEQESVLKAFNEISEKKFTSFKQLRNFYGAPEATYISNSIKGI